jgi:hypothetical protein
VNENTPTPWELDAILTVDGVRTHASIYQRFHADSEECLNSEPLCTMNYQDAAFIVSAVNTHDALVAALQSLHDNLAEYQRINNLGGYDNQDMQQARAALELARKK